MGLIDGDGNGWKASLFTAEVDLKPNTDNQSKSFDNKGTNDIQSAGSKLGEFGMRESQLKAKFTNEVPTKPVDPPKPPDITTQATVTRNGSQVIIDAGDGDDNVGVRQDPKTGDVTVTVNGAERTFSGSDKDNLVIRAGEGNDTINVGKGVTVKLTMEGGAGDDNIDVDASVTAQQTIEGGAGNDNIKAGGGRDYINGSTGEDTIDGRGGDDVIYGGDGNDNLTGNDGNDYIDAGKGNDKVAGNGGQDVLSGGIGDDELDGGADNDVMYAGQGKDNIKGGTGTNSIYAQTADDTVESSDAKNNVNNVVVNVELTGNPGSVSIKIEGSPEFIERVEADLETMRSSPQGRAMLEAFDKSYNETRSPLSELPVVGGLFNDGTTLTIKETDGGNTEQSLGTGRTDAQINYNTRRISLGGGGWQDRPPLVGLYHEMAHAIDTVNDTFAQGTYNGTDTTNHGVNNLERVAVGLPIDHDNDPKTPEIQDPKHPSNLTENSLRDELQLPRRPRY